MSEMDDFFSVESSAPSMTGLSDSWDIDDFSIEEPELGASSSRQNLATVHESVEHATSPQSRKTTGHEGSSGSYELVSSPSAGGENSQEQKPGADQENEQSSGGVDVDGWDEDMDFFPEVPADQSSAILSEAVPPLDQQHVDPQPPPEATGKAGPVEAAALPQNHHLPPNKSIPAPMPPVMGGTGTVADDVSFFDNFLGGEDALGGGADPQQSRDAHVDNSTHLPNSAGMQQGYGLASINGEEEEVAGGAALTSGESAENFHGLSNEHRGDGSVNQNASHSGATVMMELRGALENDVRDLAMDEASSSIIRNAQDGAQDADEQRVGESLTHSSTPPVPDLGENVGGMLLGADLGNVVSTEQHSSVLGGGMSHVGAQGWSENRGNDAVGQLTSGGADGNSSYPYGTSVSTMNSTMPEQTSFSNDMLSAGFAVEAQKEEVGQLLDPAGGAGSPAAGAANEQSGACWNQSLAGAAASGVDQAPSGSLDAFGKSGNHGAGAASHAVDSWNQYGMMNSAGFQAQTGIQAALGDDVAFFDQLDQSGPSLPAAVEPSSSAQPDFIQSTTFSQPQQSVGPAAEVRNDHQPLVPQPHHVEPEGAVTNSYQHQEYAASGDQYYYNYQQQMEYPQAAVGDQYHHSFSQSENQVDATSQGDQVGYGGTAWHQPQQPSWSSPAGNVYQPPPQQHQAQYLSSGGAIHDMNPPSISPPQDQSQQPSVYAGYNYQAAAPSGLAFPVLANPLDAVDDVSFFDNLGGSDLEPATMSAGIGGSTEGGQPAVDTAEPTTESAPVIPPQSVAEHEDGQSLQPVGGQETAPNGESSLAADQGPREAANQVPQTNFYDGSFADYNGANMHPFHETATHGFPTQSADATVPPQQVQLDQGVGVASASESMGSFSTWNQNDQASGQPYEGVSLFQPQLYHPSPSYGGPQQQWGGAGEVDYALPADDSMRLAPSVPVASETNIPDAYSQSGGQSNWPRHLHGRPACPLISFGIGGRVALMIPKASLSETTCGQIEIHSLRNLPTILSHRQREAGFDIPAGGVDPVRAAIERFPGPLGAATSRDKLAAFITERMELCTEEEPECDDPEGLKALWRTLRVMVNHPGFLVDRKAKPDPVANQEFIDTLSADGAVKKSWMGNGGSAVLSHQETDNQFQRQTAAVETQKLVTVGNLEGALEAAKAGGLWDVALVLSQSLGHKAFCDTASMMATQKLTLGSPLRMLFQLISGHHENAMEERDGAGVNKAPIMGVSAGYSLMTPETDPVLDDWRGNLAMLATNKTAFSKDVASKLGDRLSEKRDNLMAAHLCYLVGGVLPQSMEETAAPCRLALLGWNHKRSCQPCAAVIQRTEIFEWAYTASNPANRIVALQPYKLLYAWTLAEYGKISEAAHYCELVLEALKSLGNKVPPGLMVCAASARELLERIQQHAVIYNISLKRSSTLLESFGRILDKGINRLIGMGDQPLGEEGGLSRRSSQSEGRTPSDVISSYKRTTSQTSFESMRNMSEENRQRLSPQPPTLSTSPSPHTPKHYYDALPPPAAKYPPPTPRTPPTPTAPVAGGVVRQPSSNPRAAAFPPPSGGPLTSPRGQTQRASNHGGGGKAGGGWFSKLWGVGGGKPKDADGGKSNVKVANLGQSNQFYYDNALGRWVVPGEEDKVQGPTSAPPPPTTLEWGGARSQSPRGETSRTASQGGLGGRYVDTFGGGNQAHSPAPLQFPGVPPRGATTKPPNFFVPSTSGASKASDTEFEDVAL
ncbi:hypothetical protein BSKO_07285 [Bryopsis sp. KO-2023]|nr:hypothetical protein BSKO_07285 [Bryopsis sp. KO-2023]